MIVGRLVQIVGEEDAFWMFCQLIETYFPLDYFQLMLGAMVDQ